MGDTPVALARGLVPQTLISPVIKVGEGRLLSKKADFNRHVGFGSSPDFWYNKPKYGMEESLGGILPHDKRRRGFGESPFHVSPFGA